jgi:hypothetical protein
MATKNAKVAFKYKEAKLLVNLDDNAMIILKGILGK